MTEFIYAAYDNGKLIGEKTSREWEKELPMSKQTIRDYARSGVAYKGRYIFRMVEDKPQDQEDTRITGADLEKFKRSLRIGARVTAEKVVVIQKFPHIVKLASLKNPAKVVTMTYMELLMQKRARVKKRMLTTGR